MTPDEKKLAKLDPVFARKVRAVLDDMRGKGWRPFIAEGLRTKAQQAEKMRLKLSRTMNSYHRTGKAADIVDERWGWNKMPIIQKVLWIVHIRSTCKAHGLTSGSFWTRYYGKYGDWAHVSWGESKRQ